MQKQKADKKAKVANFSDLNGKTFNVDSSIFDAGFVPVCYIAQNKTMVNTMSKGIPTNLIPLDDFIKLGQVRKIVSDVDASEKKTSVVEKLAFQLAAGKILNKYSASYNQAATPKLIVALQTARNIEKNYVAIISNPNDNEVKKFLVEQIKGMFNAIDKYSVALHKSKFTDKLPELKTFLEDGGVLDYLFKKFSDSNTVPNLATADLSNILFPKKAESMMYLTLKELQTMGIPKFLENPINSFYAKEAHGIKDERSANQRIFPVPVNLIKNMTEYTSLPKFVGNGFSDLQDLSVSVLHLLTCTPRFVINQKVFYEIAVSLVTDEDLDIKYDILQKPREQFIEFMKKEIKNEISINGIRKMMQFYPATTTVDKNFVQFVNEGKLKYYSFDNSEQAKAKNEGKPVLVTDEKIWTGLKFDEPSPTAILEIPRTTFGIYDDTLNIDDKRAVVNKDYAFLYPKRANVDFGLLAQSPLSPRAKEFLTKLGKSEKNSQLYLRCYNYLKTFRNEGFMNIAVTKLAANLLEDSIDISVPTEEQTSEFDEV